MESINRKEIIERSIHSNLIRLAALVFQLTEFTDTPLEAPEEIQKLNCFWSVSYTNEQAKEFIEDNILITLNKLIRYYELLEIKDKLEKEDETK